MGSRGGAGCFGVVGLLIVVSMIISLIVFLVGVAAAVVGLGAAGWLFASAMTDLGRRRDLADGTDPLLQVGTRAHEIAAPAHLAAHEALSTTLSAWHHLNVTRGIGTPLQSSFDQLERRTLQDAGFQDLLLRAETAHSRSLFDTPTSVADLARETVELDQLNSDLRHELHELSPDTD